MGTVNNEGNQVQNLADELDTMSGAFSNHSHDTYASQTWQIRMISRVRAVIPARFASGFPWWNWGTIVVGTREVGTTE